MSDITHEEAHTGPIKTPKQLFWVSVGAFVLPVFIIIGLVYFVTTSNKLAPGATDVERGIAERLQKIGTVEVRDANRPLVAGAEVYKAQCAACHATGTAGAPKFEDTAAWAPRIALGFDTLVQSALKGKGGMAPQGGGNFTDTEIARAVAYMANAAGAKFTEPAAPAAGGSAAASAEAAPAPAAAAAPAAAPAATPAPAAPASAEAAPAAAAPAAATAAVDPAVGKALYDKSCVACHGAGVAGAPKFGDKAAWAPYLATGIDTMLKVAITGKGAMPPRGASTATDDELRAAIQYMADAAK
ncbi:c-type cytochrome [Ottowia flava]|uniref:C-type cytochrome n=1 Tax=Ottowia flava TaxID=2675430 RepID=A0ABW4KXV5_9BURK